MSERIGQWWRLGPDPRADPRYREWALSLRDGRGEWHEPAVIGIPEVSLAELARLCGQASGQVVLSREEAAALLHRAYRAGVGECTGGMEPAELLDYLLARLTGTGQGQP